MASPLHEMTFAPAVIPYEVWLGGTWFYGGSVIFERVLNVCNIIEKNPSVGIPNMLIGESGSYMQPGILYVWCSLLLSVRTRQIIPTNPVLALVPSDVSSIIFVGVSLPVKILCMLQMMAVAELSTTNGDPYVSQAKDSLLGRFVAKTFTCIVGSSFCCLGRQRRRPCWTKILFSFEYIYALSNLVQRIIIPRIIGYKYTKSISVKYINDLSIPLGGSVNSFRGETYGIVRCRGL